MQPQNNQLTFRNFSGEQDTPLLFELNLSSRKADGDPEPITLEDIANALANMDRWTLEQGVVIAFANAAPIGYSRLGWYSSCPENRLYYQVSFLREECRSSGFWLEIVAENERRLRGVAAGHTPVSERYFQAWASDRQTDWMAVLASAGYQVVRRFNNMLYRLGDAPTKPLPAGVEIRPVLPEHMRQVWEAQKELNAGLFENVADNWLDDKYPAWLANPENKPHFWQVAWEGDQLAGMVMAHLSENQNMHGRQGHTEHIYVRPQWRGRGLASALIAHSLQVLKAQGATQVELGVDAENESAAFRLYERLGYRTFSIDTWYRKWIPLERPGHSTD